MHALYGCHFGYTSVIPNNCVIQIGESHCLCTVHHNMTHLSDFIVRFLSRQQLNTTFHKSAPTCIVYTAASMSDGVYETVPTVPAWSSGSAHHLYSSSKALPVPSKVAIDSYTSTHPPEPRTQRPSLQDDAMVTCPPLPPPRQHSSNSESEISSSPKHSSAMLNRVKSVKGGGVVSDRISPGGVLKSPSATSVNTTELSLTAFVDKYSSFFPQRVKVTKGFCKFFVFLN